MEDDQPGSRAERLEPGGVQPVQVRIGASDRSTTVSHPVRQLHQGPIPGRIVGHGDETKAPAL